MSHPPEMVKVAMLRMRYLAEHEGIDPNSPLGHWVEAIQAMTISLASLLNQVSADAQATVRASEASVKATEQHTLTAIHLLRFKTDQLEAQLVETLAPAVAAAVGKAVVIRERRHNSRVRWSFVGGVAGVALMLVFAGWMGRGAADSRHDTEIRSLAVGMARCETHAVSDAQGQRWCRLEPTRSR